MRLGTRSWSVCAALALCTIAMTLKAQPASAETAYSVSETNKLVRFDTHEPGQTIVGTISGMIEGDQILSIERAQYWPDPARSWYEAHNSFGVTSTATRWGLAEGRVGMAGNYQTYILWANPNADPSDVTITSLRESGATLVKSFTVQPGNRFNVAVSGPDTPEIVNERFGVVITATRPIAVERAMYSDQGGVTWQAGTNATATRLP